MENEILKNEYDYVIFRVEAQGIPGPLSKIFSMQRRWIGIVHILLILLCQIFQIQSSSDVMENIIVDFNNFEHDFYNSDAQILKIQNASNAIEKTTGQIIDFEYVFDILNAEVSCKHNQCEITVNYFSHHPSSYCPQTKINCVMHTEKENKIEIDGFDKYVKHILIKDMLKYDGVSQLCDDLTKIFQSVEPTLKPSVTCIDDLALKTKCLQTHEVIYAIFDVTSEKEILPFLKENESLLAVEFEPLDVTVDWSHFVDAIRKNSSIRLLKFRHLSFDTEAIDSINENQGNFAECGMSQLMEVQVDSSLLPLNIIQNMLKSLINAKFSLQSLYFSGKVWCLDVESLLDAVLQFTDFLLSNLVPKFKGSDFRIDLIMVNLGGKIFNDLVKVDGKSFRRYFTERLMRLMSQTNIEPALDISLFGCYIKTETSNKIDIYYFEMDLFEKQFYAGLAKELDLMLTIKGEDWYIEKETKCLSLPKLSPNLFDFYKLNVSSLFAGFTELHLKDLASLKPYNIDLAGIFKICPNIKSLHFEKFQLGDCEAFNALMSISKIDGNKISLNALTFGELALEISSQRRTSAVNVSVEEFVRCFESLDIKKIIAKNIFIIEEDIFLKTFELILAFLKISTIRTLGFREIIASHSSNPMTYAITSMKNQLLKIITEVRSKPLGTSVSVKFHMDLPWDQGHYLYFHLAGKSLNVECEYLEPQDIRLLKDFANGKLTLNDL